MIMKVGMVVTMRSSSSNPQKLGCSPDSSGAATALQPQATPASSNPNVCGLKLPDAQCGCHAGARRSSADDMGAQ